MGASGLPRQGRRLSPRQWADLARAALELGLARWRLSHKTVRNALGPSNGERELARRAPNKHKKELVHRVAFAIPRVSSRVPWRADCLVQALAARRWLDRFGIANELHVGVRSPAGECLDAHAWLTCGGTVVTGGDVATYVPFTQPEILTALCDGPVESASAQKDR